MGFSSDGMNSEIYFELELSNTKYHKVQFPNNPYKIHSVK